MKSKKCKNSACSQYSATWQTDAIGFRSVTLASPLIFCHQSSYNNNSPGTFRYHLM
jgi:hypothetical protein